MYPLALKKVSSPNRMSPSTLYRSTRTWGNGALMASASRTISPKLSGRSGSRSDGSSPTRTTGSFSYDGDTMCISTALPLWRPVQT